MGRLNLINYTKHLTPFKHILGTGQNHYAEQYEGFLEN